MSDRRCTALGAKLVAVVLASCVACAKPGKTEPVLELKEEPVYGYAIRLPQGATMRVETTTPGEPSSRVFTAADMSIEVRVADRDGPLAVKTLEAAITSIPPTGMARPIEKGELSPMDFQVVTAPSVGKQDVWVWRHGTVRFARARCVGPDARLAQLKEICSSLRTID